MRSTSSWRRSSSADGSRRTATRMSHERRNSSWEPTAARRSTSLRSSTRYWASRVSPWSSLPASCGRSRRSSTISGPAVCRPGAKWAASPRLAGRSSMNRTFSGRSWASSTMAATRGPLGVQSMRAKTNSSHRSAASSSARTGASSFFEQMALTMPRRLRVRTSWATTGSSRTGPSLRVPDQRVSSRSHTTSLTGDDSASAGRTAPSGLPSRRGAPDPVPVPATVRVSHRGTGGLNGEGRPAVRSGPRPRVGCPGGQRRRRSGSGPPEAAAATGSPARGGRSGATCRVSGTSPTIRLDPTYRRLSDGYHLPDGWRRVYCHHIRKTAGTSLFLSFLALGGEDPMDVWRRINAARLPRTISGPYAFASIHRRLLAEGAYLFGRAHRPAEDQPLPPGTFTVTVLRDPVARVHSYYDYLVAGDAPDTPGRVADARAPARRRRVRRLPRPGPGPSPAEPAPHLLDGARRVRGRGPDRLVLGRVLHRVLRRRASPAWRPGSTSPSTVTGPG